MAKSKKLASLMRGLAALMAVLLVLSVIGAGVADKYRSALDDTLGTQSYVTITDADKARFKSDYATIEEMAAAAKNIAIREGEEGTVVMKNDNAALPLADGAKVALSGLAAYAPYPYNSGDLKAGNEDAVDLVQALKDEGIKVNETLEELYMNKILNKHIEMVPNRWTGVEVPTETYDIIYTNAPGDMANEFRVVEVPPENFVSEFGLDANWKSSIETVFADVPYAVEQTPYACPSALFPALTIAFAASAASSADSAACSVRGINTVTASTASSKS